MLGCHTSFTVFFSGDTKKKKKKSSENDQLTGHFSELFYLFFSSPNLNLKKKSCKSINKKILAKISILPQVLFYCFFY